jgi:hypothetical protein
VFLGTRGKDAVQERFVKVGEGLIVDGAGSRSRMPPLAERTVRTYAATSHTQLSVASARRICSRRNSMLIPCPRLKLKLELQAQAQVQVQVQVQVRLLLLPLHPRPGRIS